MGFNSGFKGLMLVHNKDSFYRSLNYYPKQIASGFSDISFPLSLWSHFIFLVIN